MHAPVVASVEDECRMMSRCSCGAQWELAFNEVTLTKGTWIDYVAVRCAECARQASFAFDISSFFVPRPGVWNTYRWASPPRLGHIHRQASTRASLTDPARAVA